MDKLRVGLIGLGTMSKLHFDAYKSNPQVEVTALCDINRQRLEEKAELWGISQIYEDVEKLLAIKDIDAVSIITSTNTHAPITIAALNAGKHVLCEKPPAVNAREAHEMKAAADRSGKLLMFGLCFRFTEKVEIMKEFINAGTLGEIYYAKAGWLRRCGSPGGWFTNKIISGGGPLMDIGVHVMDAAMYVMGSPKPVSVYGMTYARLGSRANIKGKSWYRAADHSENVFNTEDIALAVIKFENGASLFVETSFVSNIKADVKYLEFFGDKAGAKLEPGFEIFGEQNNYLVDIKPVIDDDTIDWEKSIHREITHFVDCVTNGTKCKSPAEDAIKVMSIIDTIYKSSETGMVIDL